MTQRSLRLYLAILAFGVLSFGGASVAQRHDPGRAAREDQAGIAQISPLAAAAYGAFLRDLEHDPGRAFTNLSQAATAAVEAGEFALITGESELRDPTYGIGCDLEELAQRRGLVTEGFPIPRLPALWSVHPATPYFLESWNRAQAAHPESPVRDLCGPAALAGSPWDVDDARALWIRPEPHPALLNDARATALVRRDTEALAAAIAVQPLSEIQVGRFIQYAIAMDDGASLRLLAPLLTAPLVDVANFTAVNTMSAVEDLAFVRSISGMNELTAASMLESAAVRADASILAWVISETTPTPEALGRALAHLIWVAGARDRPGEEGPSVEERMAAARLLLAAGASVNGEPGSGLFSGVPLMAAADIGSADYLSLLIEHGADVNISDLDGKTPLVASASAGQADAVDALLAAGADANPISNCERGLRSPTPLQAALAIDRLRWTDDFAEAAAAQARIVSALLAAGADPNAPGCASPPLGFALNIYSYSISQHDLRLLDLLLEAGADPNADCRCTGAYQLGQHATVGSQPRPSPTPPSAPEDTYLSVFDAFVVGDAYSQILNYNAPTSSVVFDRLAASGARLTLSQTALDEAMYRVTFGADLPRMRVLLAAGASANPPRYAGGDNTNFPGDRSAALTFATQLASSAIADLTYEMQYTDGYDSFLTEAPDFIRPLIWAGLNDDPLPEPDGDWMAPTGPPSACQMRAFYREAGVALTAREETAFRGVDAYCARLESLPDEAAVWEQDRLRWERDRQTIRDARQHPAVLDRARVFEQFRAPPAGAIAG